jgi:hypothetical protein
VLVFALFGLPWWLVLRRSVYHAVPWVSAPLVSAAVWMTLGLMLGLIALSILAARGVPAPSERRPTPGEAGARARVETPALVERRFSGKNIPGP